VITIAATHHHFIREIPVLARYETRVSIGSWDQKWVYLVVRFVTRRSSSRTTSSARPSPRDTLTLPPPAVHTAAATPLSSGTGTPATDRLPEAVDVSAAAARITQAAANTAEPDGATLHCVAVSVICLKHGRITVPPSLVFALEGMSSPAPSGTRPYEATNPPPSWPHARELREDRDRYVKFVCGGWRNLPEEGRWWERAVGGEAERVRKERLGELKGLTSGLFGAKGCIPVS
jgi:hypothetical protein